MQRSVNCPGPTPYARSLQGFSQLLVTGDASVAPYTANFIGGQVGALQANFPCACEALGSAIFAALARAYSVHYPSREWDLNLYGAGFHELLLAQQDNPRAAACNWRLLAAVARVEYGIAASYYADDGPATAGGTSDCGERGTARLLAADADLSQPWNTAALQRSNPFADIPGTLAFNREIAIYRQGWRVKVCHADADPADGRSAAGAP